MDHSDRRSEGGRILPIDKGSDKEWSVAEDAVFGAKDGELVEAEQAGPKGRMGLPKARIVVRLGDPSAPPAVRRTWWVSMSAASAALVVAVAGPIGFVGLVVPHGVRHLHGPLHRRLIPLSLLAGAIFVMLAYVISRIMPDFILPIGAVTALVGGPFFLILLAKRRAALPARD